MISKLLKRFILPVLSFLLLSGCDSRFIVLNPAGPVGQTEYHLIVLSTILTAIIIIPVIGILCFILYRYRDRPDNKAPYSPNWEHSKLLEVIWWGIPIVIIGILGFETAKTTYSLTKPPASNAQPMTIQVMSLNWKWLFLYPDQKVATVNYCEIPAGVPVQFVLTADAPMNSFWVPQLGGQEYTMPGMQMRLWLQADQPGSYFGSGANFTGEGFAHMQFQVISKSQTDFNQWVSQTRSSSPVLTQDGFNKLTEPGLEQQLSFSSFPDGIFHGTVMKDGGQYMGDMSGINSDNSMNNMGSMGSMAGMNMSQNSTK